MWKRILVGALACVVVFCTLSALSLPAVTGGNTEYLLEQGALLAYDGAEEAAENAPEEVPPEDEAPAEEPFRDAPEEAPPTDAASADDETPETDEPIDAAAPDDPADGEMLEVPADGEPPEARAEAPAEPDGSGAPGLRSGIYYSSELEDFVTGVVIRDGEGNDIPPDGTVYIGEHYSISISFAENGISGQEKQFQYNEDGYLTYQIPPEFVCLPVNDGTLTDSNGDIVGSYTIESSGLLRVRFIDGYIDRLNTSMNITLNVTASGSGGTGMHSIDFGGYIIEVNVSSAGRLEAEKTAGSYDPLSHSIGYEVEVRAKNGSVREIVYTDIPTSQGLTIDPDTIVYTSLDGETVYSAPPAELGSGEGFLVRYRAVLDESIYQGVSSFS